MGGEVDFHSLLKAEELSPIFNFSTIQMLYGEKMSKLPNSFKIVDFQQKN
jgi:hypothetical protein